MAGLGGKLRQIGALRRCLGEARAASGRPIRRQLAEIARLRRRPNRLTWEEYFELGLFDVPADRHSGFCGIRMGRALDALLNDFGCWGPCNDKLLFDISMRALGYPLAELSAVFCREPRSIPGGVPVFTEPGRLAEFLRDGMRYPCFAKPMASGSGCGAFGFLGHDPARDAIRLHGGGTIGVERFVADDLLREPRGYLFQETLAPHPEVAALTCPTGISGLRLVVLMRASGPVLFRVIWKILQGDSLTDHYAADGGRGGTSENLMAWVEPQSGRIVAVRQRRGSAIVHHTHNPESGAALVGALVPGWRAVRDLCLAASREIAGYRFQHWDICLAERGPVLLEANVRGSLPLAQCHGMGGLLDAEFHDFLAELGHDLATPRTLALLDRLLVLHRIVDTHEMEGFGLTTFYDSQEMKRLGR